MNRIIFLAITFCIMLPGISFAGDDVWEAAFEKGNELYAKEQYSNALEHYEIALLSGHQSWELCFNIGNAHYRSGNYPLAILYYEKAMRLNPKERDIQENLTLAEHKIADRFESMPEFLVTAWWLGFIKTFSATGWAIVIFVMFFLSLASVFFYMSGNTHGKKRAGFYCMIASSALRIVSFIAAVGVYNESKKEYAIVMQVSVDAKTSPEDRSQTAFILHEGSKVLIEDRIGPYGKVRIKNGSRAWVPLDCLELI